MITVDFEGIATCKEGQRWLKLLDQPFYFITSRFPNYKRYQIIEAEEEYSPQGVIYIFPFENKIQFFNNNSVLHISANPADCRLIKHTPSEALFFHSSNFDSKWKSKSKKVL